MAKDLNEIADGLRSDFIREHVGQLDAIAAELDSPLEVAILWAICNHFPSVEVTGFPCALPGRVNREASSVIYLHTVTDPLEVEVWPQLEISAAGHLYRLDFALAAYVLDSFGHRSARRAYVDLELDGHDYHERTKEQAERDKRRDRDLQSIGWNVARFTGSQVYRDPAAVAGEAIGFASGLAWRVGE